MRIYHDLAILPPFKNAVITIGTFDGVHRGHREIIRILKKEAQNLSGVDIVITFDPHPRKVVQPEKKDHIRLLSPTEEKKKLLEIYGVSTLVVVPFTMEFATMEAETYIKDFIWKYFRPSMIIIGYDHHFGKGRKGDRNLLEKRGEELGFQIKQVPPLLINKQKAISSTFIRTSLEKGEIQEANLALGYSYYLEGKVEQGQKLGRTLGFPTANLKINCKEKLLPKTGVYAVNVFEQSQNRFLGHGMMNIGYRPTVDSSKKISIETNIFNFNENLYNRDLHIELKSFLRNEVQFSGLPELKQQLQIDREKALSFFLNTDSMDNNI